MSPEELEAFLTEMEPDIRAADRDMREIGDLEKKGVTGAGKLAGLLLPDTRFFLFCSWCLLWVRFFLTDHEALQPRLDVLLDAYQKDFELATSLEQRTASLMERHATHVRATYDRWS
jgi:hypothetical protein